MIIRVTVGNNLKKTNKNVEANTTLRSVLEEAGIDCTAGTMHLDGATLEPGALNKTFADFGYDGSAGHDTCYLLQVVKANNA